MANAPSSGGERDLSYLPEDTVPQMENERLLQERIEEFERTIAATGDRDFLPLVAKLPEGSVDEQRLKQALHFPFALIQQNAGNPLKNSEVARRVAAQKAIPVEALYLTEPDPLRFGYGEVPDFLQQKNIKAAFTKIGRQMMLGKGVDFSRKINLLYAVHEAFHVSQIAEMNKALTFWIRFYADGLKERPRVIINDEYPTYGMEVEAANLMTGNALRDAALQQRRCNEVDILKQLGATDTEDVKLVQMIMQLAAEYYPTGSAINGTYPERYKELVRRITLRDGFDVYEKQGDQLTQVVRT